MQTNGTMVNVSTTTGLDKQNLVIEAFALEENTHFVVKLEATRGNQKATAQYRFQTSQEPYDGTCDVW